MYNIARLCKRFAILQLACYNHLMIYDRKHKMANYSKPYKKVMLVTAFIGAIMVNSAQAAPTSAIEIAKPVLNKISYDIAAEDWAKTATVMVEVSVDAIFNENNLEQVRTNILKKLNQLAPNAQWHITTFARNPDQSGLERLQLQAQSRVNNTALGNLRQQAKALSKPGVTITITNIDYSPSLAEVEATKLALHKQIYNQAKAELVQLNQLYPNQKYYLHTVEFLSQQQSLEPQPLMRMNLMAANSKPVAMPVAGKVIITARVTLASTIAPTA
jgi:hypothetical protein